MTLPSDERFIRGQGIGQFIVETSQLLITELAEKCAKYEKDLALLEEVRKARRVYLKALESGLDTASDLCHDKLERLRDRLELEE